MLLKKRILPLALSAIMAVSALTGWGGGLEKKKLFRKNSA